MSYLILTRTVRQRITLHVDANVDAESMLHNLRTEGISIDITAMERRQVKLGIAAPRGVTILRAELAGRR
ncbi:hypothetical protein C4K14_4028 [Pseudomonas chlororaphis subsp. aureofaciens]|uniref:carbon storage regulator n=1 Tax=Pseudomonas chlororaphis TaxID=587753 RepID=UPI000F569DCA|nr:carbon storage regulator [Pseudomonas chlororaphis]AZD86850.1 hypothetical protein C4K14_4028 [Pseudomonas chlororaphis subsp. aureofaciens]